MANSDEKLRVLAWDDGSVRPRYPEATSETFDARVAKWDDYLRRAAIQYPNGIAATISEHLNEERSMVARARTLHDPEQGIAIDDLAWADVVVWWHHMTHQAIDEETVDRVVEATRAGDVGLVVLHSAHNPGPFTQLLGSSGDLEANDAGEAEHVTVADPDHPIAAGIEDFTVPEVETYDEPFDIPEPDSIVFRSEFDSGATFRSGITFTVDDGRLFYFRPGDEQYRIYHQMPVRRVLANGVRWVADETS